VKARFSRRAGRVPCYCASTAAHILPGAGAFRAAARRHHRRAQGTPSPVALRTIIGVGVRLLIDAAALGARLTEVDIGISTRQP